MQVERVHTFDWIITSTVAITQLALAWVLFSDWRKRMAPFWFGVALVSACFIWVISGYGIWFTVTTKSNHRPPGPGWLHSLGSSVELLWTLVSGIVLLVYFVYGFAAKRLDAAHHPSRRYAMRAIAAVSVSAPVAAIAVGATAGRLNVRVIETELPVGDLHPDLQGLRIAQVSDFHVSPFLSVRDAARVVDMTNELKPHLTFMTGDLITEEGDPLDDAIREICRLRADAGVLGCLGNHEVYARCQAYVKQEAAKRGVRFLRKEAVQLRFGAASLNVAGVDFQASRYRSRYLQGAETLLRPGMANLLLSHNPDVFPKAAEQGWDAMLAGHTHGGQVTVEILEQTLNLARFLTPYVAGLYRMGKSSCYVTRGIGTIGMPVRIGDAPEITLLRLVRA